MRLERVLIANRGEIALRVIRACYALGLETVAAYSKVDRELRHLDLATETVCISASSYLDAAAFVGAALSRGCDSVHPGYGLLSENPDFARAVTEAGLTFVGPSEELLRTMGDKIAARDTVSSLGLDLVPATTLDSSDAQEWAASTGYPVIVKAARGGGGRGMRRVDGADELDAALQAAKSEAAASFGSGDVYLEKFLERARHVEVQVLGDGGGKAIHLGTRDCSVQRNYQKVVEEAPAPFIPPAALERIAVASADAAAGMNYSGAGTFEFLYQDGRFCFIEMNTRLQVEHPVTEAITGIDLVAAQLEIASEGRLPWRQEDITFTGHAIECRLNAETMDASGRLSPSPGKVDRVVFPGGPGVRIDSHLYAGYTIPHQYDSLVGKVITQGISREVARARMRVALAETEIAGVETNLPLLAAIMTDAGYASGDLGPGVIASARAAT